MDAHFATPTSIPVARSAVRYLAISAIKPNTTNPRTHSKKQIGQIAASIKSFGFNVPLLIDADNQLIAGHGRLLAAKQLGYTEVPTLSLSHLTPEQARAFMIADNKLTENGGWDADLLTEHFEDLQRLDLDFSITDTGYELAEIDFMFETKRRQKIAPPETPLTAGPAVCEPGDLWLMGEHRLLCGDARSATDYERLMGSRKAAMVFADAPYNVVIDGHATGKGDVHHREFAMASGEMSPREFTAFLNEVCHRMSRAARDGSIHYICMDWRHMRELLDATRDVYSELKNLCIWNKDNAGMGSLYRSQHELVFVFKNGTAAHVNNVELGRYGRNRSNVWNYPGVNSFGRNTADGNLLELHPTVKPTDMVADAILDCSRRGAIVLDPFLGSGTTLLAAERSGRIAYGMEIDPLYVDTAIRRWQRATGEVATHEGSGRPFGSSTVTTGMEAGQ